MVLVLMEDKEPPNSYHSKEAAIAYAKVASKERNTKVYVLKIEGSISTEPVFVSKPLTEKINRGNEG